MVLLIAGGNKRVPANDFLTGGADNLAKKKKKKKEKKRKGGPHFQTGVAYSPADNTKGSSHQSYWLFSTLYKRLLDSSKFQEALQHP